ncbi:ABC transporter permease [Mycoplasma iguanae]|uniref:ABC transporter permease n=1 Tax=Mycoplasma iguanae TaxID=292461 RepID=A0ABY5R9H1_9MOLU|nr:ABC transporter permease [Mycoplasma iguanae]UVD81429.1 ABC transporter permease [Mycoplasma iguanae]
MLRLLKEVFKSLSKNKVVMIGLAILTFLSSGIFTLLSTVNQNYSTQYENYKNVSVLQDATVDLSLNFLGKANNNGYDIQDEEDLAKRTYYPANDATKIVQKFLIPQSKEYVSLFELGIFNSTSANTFIKSADLLNEYNRFLRLGIASSTSTVFDLENNFFIPRVLEGISFPIYTKNISGQYAPIKQNYIFIRNETVTLDRAYSLKEIANINRGDQRLGSQITDDYLTNISSLFINVKTKEATFDVTKSEYWAANGLLLTLDSKKVAQFLNVEENKEIPGRFYFKNEKAVDNKLFVISTNTATDPNSIWSLSSYNKIIFNENAQTISSSISNIDFGSIINKEADSQFTFQRNIRYLFPESWSIRETVSTYYVRTEYKLNFDADQNNWTGAFKQYIENLQKDNPAEFKKIQNISFWEKIEESKNNRNFTTKTRRILTIEDLKEPIALENGNQTSIALVENISNNPFEQQERLKDISNPNIKDDTFLKIRAAAAEIAKDEVVNEILKPKYGVENIGIRQTLTAQSIDRETGKSQIFHFINAGDEKQQINGVEQKVGKLFEETNNKTANSRLFIENNDINFNIIEPIYVSKIIEMFSRGFISDENYLKANIRYVDYTYYTSQTKIPQTIKNSQIVVLKSIISQFNNFAVTGKENKFRLLKRPDNSVIDNWEFYDLNGKEWITLEELNDWIIKNNITLDGKIQESWLEQDSNNQNIFYLPLEYYLPKASIIRDVEENNSLEELFKNVKNFFVNSSIVKENFFSEEDITKLLDSIRIAMENNNFQAVFNQGKFIPSTIQKIIFEGLNLANIEYGQDFVKNIFTKLLANIKKKIEYDEENNLRTEDEKKAYFSEQLRTVFKLIKNIFNFDLANILGETFSSDNLVEYFSNPGKTLDGLIEILESFNAFNFFKNINDWYQTKWNLQDEKGNYYYISTSDILIQFFNSINYDTFKNGIKTIIDSIDFNAMLNPANPVSLYNSLSEGQSEAIKQNLKDFFRKLNSPNNSVPYSNIPEGLKKIVDLLDFNYFAKNLQNSVESYQFENLKTFESGLTKSVTFTANLIKESKYLAILIKAVTGGDNPERLNEIKETLITTFNLSGKVINNFILISPANDNEKIDINALNLFNSLSKGHPVHFMLRFASLKQRFEDEEILTIEDLEFIKSYLPSITNEELNNRTYIQDFINNFETLYQKINPFAYLNNLNPDPSQWTLSLNINEGRNKTIGDLLLEFNNRSIGNGENSILNIVKKVSSSLLQNSNSVDKPTSEAIGIYAILWKMAYENRHLSRQRLNIIFNELLNLVNDNTEIFNILNNKNLLTKMYTQNLLDNSSIEDLQVTVGQVFAKETAEKVWEAQIINNEQQFKLAQINALFNNNALDDNIKTWIINNKEELTYLLSLIASGVKNNNGFRETTKAVWELAFTTNAQTSFNDKELEILYNMAKSAASSTTFLEILGLPKILASTYLTGAFPEVALWITTNPNNKTIEGSGNLAYIIRDRIYNFSKIPLNDIVDILEKNDNRQYFDKVNQFNDNEEQDLVFNVSWLKWIENLYLKNEDNSNVTVFDLDLNALIFGGIYSILTKAYQTRLVVINDNRAYVAKISEAYATQNGKEIYTGEIPSHSIATENLIETLDEKYVLNVAGVKYLIVGFDSVIDYIYPVIDEINIQVNTADQAMVFVNKQGFDRIKSSFRSSAVKEYALVKMQDSEKSEQFVDEINEYISENFSSTQVKKAFTVNQLDPLNPERSLRVSVMDGFIYSINKFNFWIVLLLAILVSLTLLFVIQRYISTRNKVLGILRAQGYKSSEIALSFTIFSIIPTIIGSSIGYISGILVQSFLINAFSTYWTLPISPSPFVWWVMLLTILVPFILMSLVIIGTTLFALRQKPINLMSGIVDVNVGNISRAMARPFKKSGIKTKFIAALGINSFWKLFSLLISTTLTSFAMIFSTSSNGVLERAVNKTYAHRNYKYKMNLYSPTKEGGAYSIYNKADLVDSLYVPLGETFESQTYRYNYFKPGAAIVQTANVPKTLANGTLNPVVITKPSLSILINKGGISVDPWELVLNSMPDSQKARVLEKANELTNLIEKTQNIKIENGQEFVEDNGKKIDYFKFEEANDRFVYMRYDLQTDQYARELITTSNHRDEYRKFIIDAYNKIEKNDFYISFGGLLFNSETNEKYSYASGDLNNQKIIINGYSKESKFVSLYDESDNNLSHILNSYEINDDVYPLIINSVAAKRHNLGKDSIVKFKVTNNVNRFIDQFTSPKKEYWVTFKVLAINASYLNEEFSSTQEVINKITGLNEFATSQQFNGILSNDIVPTQLLDSIGIYSPSGNWMVSETFDSSLNTAAQNLQYFKEIYGENGLLMQSGLTIDQIKSFIGEQSQNIDLSSETMQDPNYAINNATIIRNALDKFMEVYGTNNYVPISTDIASKDIEIGFIQNISTTINSISTALIIIFFIISIVILILVSSIIIAENERNIAIFAILGYTTREKIILFFTIYVPVIIVATIIAIPIVIGFIALFNSFLISSSAIVIPLVVKWWHVLISIATTFTLFTLTSVFSWISLNKIKAVHLLKGK